MRKQLSSSLPGALGVAPPALCFPFLINSLIYCAFVSFIEQFFRTKLDFWVMPFGIPLKAFLADLNQWPGTETAFGSSPFLHVFSGLFPYLCPSWGLVSICLSSCWEPLIVSGSLPASSSILEVDLWVRPLPLCLVNVFVLTDSIHPYRVIVHSEVPKNSTDQGWLEWFKASHFSVKPSEPKGKPRILWRQKLSLDQRVWWSR